MEKYFVNCGKCSSIVKSAILYAVTLRLHHVFYFSFVSFASFIQKIETEGFTETLVAM